MSISLIIQQHFRVKKHVWDQAIKVALTNVCCGCQIGCRLFTCISSTVSGEDRMRVCVCVCISQLLCCSLPLMSIPAANHCSFSALENLSLPLHSVSLSCRLSLFTSSESANLSSLIWQSPPPPSLRYFFSESCVHLFTWFVSHYETNHGTTDKKC